MTSTPWGVADSREPLCRGIIFYGTPSHGGYHVSTALNRTIPDALRLDGGWYEEDCDYALVIVAFPEHFTPKQLSSAMHTVRNWHPDRYEAYFKVPILPGQSYLRDKGER